MEDLENRRKGFGEAWADLDWKSIKNTVANLRCRIFRAAKSGNIRKVRGLQKLLLSSSANIAFAVRAVKYH